jgi:hypothetical protein
MSENKRVIEHRHKLDIKLTIILALFAIGVCANAFVPAFEIKDAMAELFTPNGTLNINHSGSIYTN